MRKGMPEAHGSHPNVTPLIDVVMCLIIFFMLVAKIGVSTGAIKMDLPETILGKKIEELKGTLIINVTDPNLVIEGPDGKPVTDSKGHVLRKKQFTEPTVTALLDPADKDAREIKLIKREGAVDYPLRRVLERAVKGDPAKGIKGDPEFSVTIRAEKDLEFSMLQQVLVEIANGGVKNVNYAAKDKKTGGTPAASAQ